ncbi:MAG: ABC transporter permease [Bacteroidetes bacterium]|nr:ABC transporter permease [Bacteroidota bacterium]
MGKNKTQNGKSVSMESNKDKFDQTHKWNLIVKKYYIYAVLLLLIIVFSVMKLDRVIFFGRGHFLSPASITNLLRSAVPILTLSGAFTFLMISGNIDLSVGSAMSLSAVVYSLMILNGFNMGIAFVLTLVVGILCGFINGYLVQKLRITPVIATLVTLNLFKGVALLFVPNGESAIKGTADKIMPVWINDYARLKVFLGLPVAFYVAVLVIAILIIIQRKTILGKYAAAVGGNRTAAELSGINAKQVVWLLYILVGFMAALAGIARASYMSLGNPLSGDGMELDNIIAVLLGGTAFTGGEGSVAKTVVGALIIMCVTTGMMTVVPPYWQLVVKGSVLVLAVALNTTLVKKRVEA